MQPSEFWRTDTWTAMDAWDGYAMSKGIKQADETAWTESELAELDRMIEQDAARIRGGA